MSTPSLSAVLLSLALSLGGCLVQEHCNKDWDCPGNQVCSTEQQCVVECQVDQDCWTSAVTVGAQCVDNRCVAELDERVAAPNFCLEVVNPRSERFGEELCLEDLRGEVVAIYFALLA